MIDALEDSQDTASKRKNAFFGRGIESDAELWGVVGAKPPRKIEFKEGGNRNEPKKNSKRLG